MYYTWVGQIFSTVSTGFPGDLPTILNNFDIALLTLPVTSASSLRCSAFYGADMDLMSLQ